MLAIFSSVMGYIIYTYRMCYSENSPPAVDSGGNPLHITSTAGQSAQLLQSIYKSVYHISSLLVLQHFSQFLLVRGMSCQGRPWPGHQSKTVPPSHPAVRPGVIRLTMIAGRVH